LANDDLLEQAFAILTSAHYQTTAMDLRHMLDSPAMEIWVASMGQIPCAAALVSREGGIEETLYDDITHKRRRLKNQLLVQLLTQFTLSKKILSLQYQRIVRIAVIPQIQNQGVGSALIKAITTDNAESVDVMGTSFGADEASLAFWLKQGFSPVHLGYKRNPRSGLASVAMLLSCNEAAKPALLAAQLLLQLNLNVLRSAVDERSARDHNYVRVVDKLLSQQIQKREDSGIIDIFTPQVELYARGSRNFIDSLAALQWYLQKESLPQKSEAQALFDALLLDTLSPAVDKRSRQKNRQLANLIKKGCSLHEP
jgi:tRNA(Met) C34 N-acetyltransferase TmcA